MNNQKKKNATFLWFSLQYLAFLLKEQKKTFHRKIYKKVLEQVENKPEEVVINTMLLRSMQQAKYSEDNYGHYGLVAEYYTHFTSPIRRYPDLIVHRLIRAYSQDQSEKIKKMERSITRNCQS